MNEKLLNILDSIECECNVSSVFSDKVINLYNNLEKENKDFFLDLLQYCYEAGYSVAYG